MKKTVWNYYPSMWVPNESGCINVSGQELETLEGAPQRIYHSISLNNNFLTSLDHAPQSINGHLSCSGNMITSLHNIHKTIKSICGMFSYQFQCDGVEEHSKPFKDRKYINPTNILGLCLIQGLETIVSNDSTIDLLFKNNRDDVLKFQDALIDAGYTNQAKF